MKDTVYIFNTGTLLRKDNTLVFKTEKGKTPLPIEGIKEIFIFGEVTINKRLLEFLTQKEILLLFFNHYGYYIGAYYPREHYNSGFMIINQSQYYADPVKRLTLAKSFVRGALKNSIKIMKYYERRDKDLGDVIKEIEPLDKTIDTQKSIEELMSVEGRIKKQYYHSFNTIITNEEFHFNKRSRRPPKDYLNALISFGNTLVYSYVLTEIYKTHLDPRIGFLHAANFRRFSLNLDIAEIFKPVISDRTILHVINKHIITEKDFEKQLNGIFLNESGKKKFIEKMQERLNQTIKHGRLKKNVSYRRLIRMELYKLEKHLMGEKDYKPFVMGW